MDKKLFQGSGGGGPTSTPDSLLSEDIVEFALAVSEGPIRGLSDGAHSFYVGDTPLVAVDGTRAFDKFAIGVYPGYPEGVAQPLALKLGGVSSNVAVGVSLMKNTAVLRVTESQLRGSINSLEVRLVFNRLISVDDDGSTNVNTAHFNVEYKPSASGEWKLFQEFYFPDVADTSGSGGTHGVFGSIIDDIQNAANTAAVPLSEMTTTGKTSGGYAKEFKVSVPMLENDDWMIRVTKLSPDNDEHNVVDMTWESYQAVSTTANTFPDTAIVHGLGVANGQFSSIPDFSGVYDGLMIRVPTSYNPDTRTYDESTPWDGSFKFAWTNNPAWILFDLIVNTRYGLAMHRRYIDANRFSFYEAAKWCDEPVAISGSTETRPRYTFNMVLTESTPGMEMLSYVAGSFNALVWDDLQGQIHLRVDKDDPAVMMFTPENVTEEGFNYTYTDITTRVNDISVAFVNPELSWNEDRRRVPNVTTNEAHIQKHGRTPLDFVAVGCTNLHEALAKAQVRLISSLTETTMVSFTTTRLGALLTLYDVILIADPLMGWSQTGRLTSYDSQWLNFRDPIYIETMETYVLKLQTPNGIVELNVVPESTGKITRLALQSPLPDYIPKYATFTLEGTSSQFGYAKPFRVMSITEAEDSPYMYTISAVEINRSKYAQAEGSPTAIGSEFDYSTKVPFLPGAPYNFLASSGDQTVQVMPTGEIVARILATWDKPYGAITCGYVLQYKLVTDGDTGWQTVPTTLSTQAYVSPVVVGQHYMLRVASLDATNKQSSWVKINDHQAKGKSEIPNGVETLSATGGMFQITLNWSFGDNPAPDLTKVEVWGAATNDQSKAVKLSDLSYPTNSWVHLGLALNATMFYWVRVQDSSRNYSAWSNVATATTSSDATQVMAMLNGQITSTQLFHDLASRIDLIDAPATTIGSVAARILAESADRNTAISSESKARSDADSALTDRLDTMASTFVDNTGAIEAEAQARADAIQAEADQRNEQLATYDNTIKSYVQNYSYSKATADSTTNQVYLTLRSEYAAADSATLSSAQAYVQNYGYTKAQADSAIASSTSQVTARLNNMGGSGVTVEQAYQAQANALTGLYGQYTLKIDNNGYIAGFGVASSTDIAGANTSEFIIYADKLGLVMPGYNGVQPFTIGVAGGVPRVVLSNALIGDATISSAMIGDAQINSLKLAGEAVTVPIVVSAPDKQTRGKGEGTWSVINQGYIDLTQDGMVYILATSAQGFSNNSSYWSFRIAIDGVVVRSIMGRVPGDVAVISATTGLTKGVHHVEISWSAATSVIVGYCDLFMMGVKK